MLAKEARAGPQLRVLVINSGSSTLDANIAIESGMASVVSRDRRQSRYEIYDEVRDAQRFPGATAEQRFGDALVTKHTGQTIDAIVTAGPEALHVSIVFQTRAGSEVPVIYGCVQAATQSQ